jgi:FtsX-like permease family
VMLDGSVAIVLACRALRASPVTSAIASGLVALCVVSVLGATLVFRDLANTLVRLAVGNAGYEASVDINDCASCSRLFFRPDGRRREHLNVSLSLLANFSPVRSVTVATRALGDTRTGGRRVTVLCVSRTFALDGVEWWGTSSKELWVRNANARDVLVGAQLVEAQTSPSQPLAIVTEFGRWRIIGRVREQPLLSADAGLNQSLVVHDEGPFATLCRRGRESWRVVARDSSRLATQLSQLRDSLRSLERLAPREREPWSVRTDGAFRRLTARIVAKFSLWLAWIPVVVALLCGSGIFALNVVQSADRLHEYGIMRTVGATRRRLLMQLWTEAALIAAIGTGCAIALLTTAGAISLRDSAQFAQALTVSIGAASVLTVIGIVLPGLSAIRTRSIAALEGRGNT